MAQLAAETGLVLLDDEQRAIVETVRDFVEKEVIPVADELEHRDEFPEKIVEGMKELGLFGLTVPEEYGGAGLDLMTYALAGVELSRGLDVALGHPQHPLHGRVPAQEARDRGAEAAMAPAHGHR